MFFISSIRVDVCVFHISIRVDVCVFSNIFHKLNCIYMELRNAGLLFIT